MFTLMVLFIFVLCASLVWMHGFWGAAVTLLNVLFAGLLATNLCFVLSDQLNSVLKSFTYFWDFLSFWLIFTILFLVLRSITDTISKTRVRFIQPVEIAGRSVIALAVAWIMVCIICFSLHMAPIPKTGFRGGFQRTEMSKDFLGISPDCQWIAIVSVCSNGSLSPLIEKQLESPNPNNFIRNYRSRRSKLEKLQRDEGTFRVER